MSRATVNARPAELVPAWEAGHPLTLTTTMRNRLRAAVQALLDQPGLVGASDPVRMSALVLMAKASAAAADLAVEMTARELGRWVGVSASTVGHEVRPHLDRGQITNSEDTLRPGTRIKTGVRWPLLPLWEARHHQDATHPLRLGKPEFAVLLGLLQAVCAPGWAHSDGTQTLPGLLGRRTGRGAATDRLALLLAVLESRPTGVVRLCGGAVDVHGRPAATLARLLGCSSAAGAQVLGRLQVAGAVEVRQTTGGREQLVIPTVEAAYREMRRLRRAAGRPGRLVPGPRRVDLSAGRDQILAQKAKSQVKQGEAVCEGSDLSAGLHAYHSPMAQVVDESAGCNGFSGYGRVECCDVPECACAREDQVDPEVADTPAATGADADDALRAEQPTPPSPSSPGCLGPALSHQVPQVAGILAQVAPSPTAYQQARLERLVRGLLIEGEDDAMIAARLRERLRPLATGSAERPYTFRRDGVSWALSIGLPYTRGGMTMVPCAQRGCRNLVRGKATDNVRCDLCELAVYERRQAARALQAALEAPLPPRLAARPALPAQRTPASAAPSLQSAGQLMSVGATHESAGDENILPRPVREQLQALETIAARAAEAARRAAIAVYGPTEDSVPEAEQARRRSAATATWCAITTHYADQLAAAAAQNHGRTE
ncbi:hypothetical protein [Streptomyces sp. S186]|uniref:hypothetical protein n=1 Tax=Streptomyces sp. S186 TaxID=3434395 RepID=UPI003F6777FA